MRVTGVVNHLDEADLHLCSALAMIRRLCEDSTWQDCAETNETEVLRYRIGLIGLRNALLLMRKQANGESEVRL